MATAFGIPPKMSAGTSIISTTNDFKLTNELLLWSRCGLPLGLDFSTKKFSGGPGHLDHCFADYIKIIENDF